MPGPTADRRRERLPPRIRPLPISAAPYLPDCSCRRHRRPARWDGPGPGRRAADGVADAAGAAGALNGNLLNVDVNLDANADIAAPINGAVAANANVAAPIDAAVGANIGSIDSNAFAVAQQDAIINQDIHGDATASADQQSDLKQ